MLEVRQLEKNYGRKFVVHDVNFSVGRGEIVGLLGPNGAGKTTTFHMVVGLLRPSRGSILFDGREISHFPIYRRARAGIGYLPQEPSIFRRLTVYQNLMAVAELAISARAERRKVVEQILTEFAIEKLAGQRAHTLSGGERRRLEIARALVAKPKLLLLDEPFSGVDPISVQELQQILMDLRGRNIGVLITDHNVRETLSIVDRAYLIYEGRVLASGDRSSLLENPLSRKHYLGENFHLGA
jgi:lipopolysaccharide export system ATP-binding protein